MEVTPGDVSSSAALVSDFLELNMGYLADRSQRPDGETAACVRCVKNLVRDRTTLCSYPASFGKCSRCRQHGKACVAVPPALRGEVAAMRRLAAGARPTSEILPRLRRGVSAINAYFREVGTSQATPRRPAPVASGSVVNGEIAATLRDLRGVMAMLNNNIARFLQAQNIREVEFWVDEEEPERLIDEEDGDEDEDIE